MVHRVVVGVAGSGKTSYSMDVIERELRSGLGWHQIGFASFSRAACLEAAGRAAEIVREDVNQLQKNGWFRTIHSCALRGLGVDTKCVLDHDSVDGKKFLKDAVGSERGGEPGTLAAEVDEILSAWDFTRGQLAFVTDVDDGDLNRLSGTSGMVPGQLNGDMGHTDPLWDTRDPHKSDVRGAALSNVFIDGTDNCSKYNPIRGKRKITDLNLPDPPMCLSVEHFSKYPYRDKGNAAPGTVDLPVPRWAKMAEKGQKGAFRDTLNICIGKGKTLIQTYERQKRLYGRLDFTDILMSFAGVQVREDLSFVQVYPNGQVPEEVEVWMFDEFQDSSPLLGLVAERLAEAARDVYWLGDRYQTIYGFSGASAAVFAAKEDQAKAEGNRILLNRSWRNPEEVLEWGEQVLREDEEYDERCPISEALEGSVGLMDSAEFESVLPLLGGSDTMILARTWFALNKVKARLDEMVIPWRSCQEKTSSRWECPAKIAYTLALRSLVAGEMISEQDFRRITETLPQKWHGKELFSRGVKAKWKKAECSGRPAARLDGLLEWGATPWFIEFVREGMWRTDMPLLLDIAIDRFGIDEVRDPSVRIGSVHSVKGMQARNVFCMATSTDRIDQTADPFEEICLKYVAITRASKHYRLVVDQMDIARGKPLFWAAPKGSNEWKGFDDAGKRHSGVNCEVVQREGLDLDREGEWGSIREEWGTGSDSVRQGAIPRAGGEDGKREGGEDSGGGGREDQEEWWSI